MTPHKIASECAKRIDERRAYAMNVSNVRVVEEREMVLRLVQRVPFKFKLRAKHA